MGGILFVWRKRNLCYIISSLVSFLFNYSKNHHDAPTHIEKTARKRSKILKCENRDGGWDSIQKQPVEIRAIF